MAFSYEAKRRGLTWEKIKAKPGIPRAACQLFYGVTASALWQQQRKGFLPTPDIGADGRCVYRFEDLIEIALQRDFERHSFLGNVRTARTCGMFLAMWADDYPARLGSTQMVLTHVWSKHMTKAQLEDSFRLLGKGFPA